VPAKAGTQSFAKHWMPAFAGMAGHHSDIADEMIDVVLIV
jgi:hypothetical protein